MSATNPMVRQAPTAGAYTAGAKMTRQLAMWRPPLTSPDKAIIDDKHTIEGRANDLARNNGYAAGAVQSSRDRIVGHRYRLVLQPNFTALGIEREAAREWAKLVEALWSAYADDPEAGIDACQKRTFVDILRAGIAGDMLAGEVFLSREYRKEALDTPGKWGTCFQFVEPERVSDPMIANPRADVRMGVELDRLGAPIAYHFRTRHPDDIRSLIEGDAQEWRRVPRYSGVTWNVLHLFDHVRGAQQTRGVSCFASTMSKVKMLDRIEDAELEAALLQTVYAMVLQSSLGPVSAGEALGGKPLQNVADYLGAAVEFQNAAPLMFDGVRVPQLFPGEELKMLRAEHPNSAFEQFESAMLRHVARGWGLSYESLSGDYTKTTYSSARAAMHEAWAYVQGKRETVVSRMASMMFRAWLDEAVARQIVPLPAGVTDYAIARPFLATCQWIGAPKGIIDEVKAAKANEVKLATGETTLQRVCAENGEDFEDVLEQLAYEASLRKELETRYGVTLNKNTGTETKPGEDPADDESTDDPPKRAANE